VERNFNPAVGFLTRNAYRRYLPYVNFGPRPRNNRTVRQFNFSVTADIQTTLEHEQVARNFTLKLFETELAANDRFAVLLSPRSERLDSPFTINMAPGRRVTLPRGARYDFLRYQVNWRTSNRRPVAFDGRYEGGDFYSGSRKEFVSNVTFRILPGLFVYTAAELNSIALPEATFNTRLYRVVPELQFTPFLDGGNVWTRTVGGTERIKWTPGLGVRAKTFFGPVQVNVGYNDYLREKGPIYFNPNVATLACASPNNTITYSREPDGQLKQVSGPPECPNYSPPTRNSFWKKLTFTVSIGSDF
jgi:hypothetical protein